jgi:hypothetical protein
MKNRCPRVAVYQKGVKKNCNYFRGCASCSGVEDDSEVSSMVRNRVVKI